MGKIERNLGETHRERFGEREKLGEAQGETCFSIERFGGNKETWGNRDLKKIE